MKNNADKNKLEKLAEPVELELLSCDDMNFAGCVRRITGKRSERPKLQEAMWTELKSDGTLDKLAALSDGAIEGFVALCCNFDNKGYDYFVGVSTNEEPEEYKKFSLPEGEYAVFHCAEGQDITGLWQAVYYDELPRSSYVHTGGAELEIHNGGDVSVYVPVKVRPPREPRPKARGMMGPSLFMFGGLAVGAVLGAGKDNMLLYLTGGLIIGGAIGFAIDKSKHRREEEKARDEAGFAQSEKDDDKDE